MEQAVEKKKLVKDAAWALAEAQKQFGPTARVWTTAEVDGCTFRGLRYRTGFVDDGVTPKYVETVNGVKYLMKGVGDSWSGAVESGKEFTTPTSHMKTCFMTIDELRDFIRTSPWTFAKTMPEMPHEYTLRTRASDVKTFERVVLHIGQAGYSAEFGSATYTYLDIDGWKYWTMGSPLSKTILINRAKLESSHSNRFTTEDK